MPVGRDLVDDAFVARVAQMRRNGGKWHVIAAELGTSERTITKYVRPHLSEELNAPLPRKDREPGFGQRCPHCEMSMDAERDECPLCTLQRNGIVLTSNVETEELVKVLELRTDSR